MFCPLQGWPSLVSGVHYSLCLVCLASDNNLIFMASISQRHAQVFHACDVELLYMWLLRDRIGIVIKHVAVNDSDRVLSFKY